MRLWNGTEAELGHLELQGERRHRHGIYRLCLWPDGLPSGHWAVSLQMARTAGWGVNSPFLGAAGGAFPSKWNGPSSESLSCSLESWGREKEIYQFVSALMEADTEWMQGKTISLLLKREPHLQHRWNVLSGLPSDSDFVWTISHIAELSPSMGDKCH